MAVTDKIMSNVNVSIAGVRLFFWTNHPKDRACIEDIFLYHLDENVQSPATGDYHDVIITSSTGRFQFPQNRAWAWEGYINQNVPVRWYNSTDKEENMIFIADDIFIQHFPERKLTICNLKVKQARFSKLRRPALSYYIYFLLQSILSMHGKYCLHASCVSKNGLAYLFPGKSGEGKTTMSFILGKAGFEYLGDDLIFISQDEEGKIIANAFLTKIKLFNSNSKIKDSIDVIKNSHFNYTHKSQLGVIINLQRTHANKKSILIPATQVESFAWLMKSGNNIKIQYNKQLWMNICEHASLLPSFTLMFADKEYFEPNILETISI